MKKVRDVIFLPGWGFDTVVWDVLIDSLAPRFRARAIDFQGRAPRTLEAAAAAVARLAPRRCNVVGWSLGGEVALAWARSVPRQVRRLALIGTTPCFTRRPGWPCATPPAVLEEFQRRLGQDRAGLFARFVGAQAKGDARARGVTGALQRSAALDAPDAALAAGLDILSHADLRAGLFRVRQPALVLHGARDRIVPPAAGRRLAAMLPDARWRPLRSSGHAPFLSQPARVARLIGAFFDE